MEKVDTKLCQEFLHFGHVLLAETRSRTVSLWKNDAIRTELKEDSSPVSEIDIACEELARDKIQQRFSSHGVIGEEFGAMRADAEFVWTIDPIDGTQNLINRIPTFGTILSLRYQGQPLLGWIDHPLMDLTLSGGVSVGTYCNGVKVVLQDLANSCLGASDIIATNCPATFNRGGHGEILRTLLDFHPHTRIYHDVYAHTLTVLGSLAATVEYNLKVWDLSATQALIEGAGGVFQELGTGEDSVGNALFHAVFGKPIAVELISRAISEMR